MVLCRLVVSLFFFVILAFSTTAQAAQSSEGSPPAFPDAPGKELLMNKCFQCHSEGMWRAQRQDRRAWEGVLYRMIGRGALWTEEEINTMAGYLATAFGDKVPSK